MKEGVKTGLVFSFALLVLAGMLYLIAISIIKFDDWNAERHSNATRMNASTFSAYYYNGVIRVKANEYANIDVYLADMVHEWAHNWYDYKFTRKDMKEWLNLTASCGYESNYPWNRTMSKTMKVYEEWAECTKLQWQAKDTCCLKKREFITRTGVLNKN